jgi:hypothetical protein
VPVAQLSFGPQAARPIERRTGKNMPLITIVITLIVAGVLLWLVNTYIPMDGKIKKIINIVVVVVVVLWLLNVFGVLGHLRDVKATSQLAPMDAPTCCVASQSRAQI